MPKPHVSVRDLAEISVGACVMAFPVATTEEVWNLGTELSPLRAGLFALASIGFLALMIYALHHRELDSSTMSFGKRVIATYGVTLIIAALLLLGVDRLDLVGDFWVGVRRTVLVAFPASFAATVVDTFST